MIQQSTVRSIGRKGGWFSPLVLQVIFSALVSLFMLAQLARAAGDEPAPTPHPDWSFREAGLIPVQSGGRMKPLDSFARDLVLFTTGSRSFEGWDPVDLLFSWITHPSGWQKKAFIQIQREDVRRQLALDDKRTRFAPAELFENSALLQYAQHMPGEGAKLDQRQQELKRVLDRLGVFRNVVSGGAWLVVPKPAPAPWSSLAEDDAEGNPIRQHFVDLVRAYQTQQQDAFARAVPATRSAVQSAVRGWDDGMSRVLEAESFYNRLRPFLIAWILYLLSALLWLGAYAWPRAASFAKVSLGFAFASHVFGFLIRCYIAGRPPVTNMYESIIWVSFGVVLFSLILYGVTKQSIALLVSSALATLGLIAADSAPAMMDPGIHPLVPVLRSNYWLTIHVLTITLGYAAFALTLGIANVTLGNFIRLGLGGAKGAMARIEMLNQLTYRAMQFGVVLLAAGTILGGVWADYSWGRFWGWDPKEVWALIALLCYVGILHGRYTQWVGQFAYAAWTVAAFLSVLMAWYGVNFVLGVGLHSYGFSSGGATAVIVFTSVQLAYVLVAAFIYRRAGRFPRELQLGAHP
jgi:cytochrome c-type biogenesis protein CcsB